MIVSFTGAQSTGKTTLLNQMRNWECLKDYTFIDEITRNIKKKGMSINEKGNDDTQTAIMNAHIENLKKGDNLILDRCSLMVLFVRIISIHTEEYLKIPLIMLDRYSLKHVLDMTRYST